jgi:hypothetical protein
MKPRVWGPLTTIRLRLGAAIALALLPVLILGGAETALAFQKFAQEQRGDLTLAAQRSAATARARMEAASVLLETLAPDAIGYQCTQGLRQVVKEFPGYNNLVRFNEIGRVACATGDVPADPDRRNSAWFSRLKAGEHRVVMRAPVTLSTRPALLAAQRAVDFDGRFDGALVAVIDLEGLRPSPDDASLPSGTEVALADLRGRYLNPVDARNFGPLPPGYVGRVRTQGSMRYDAVDGRGGRRVFAIAPLVGDVFAGAGAVLLGAAEPALKYSPAAPRVRRGVRRGLGGHRPGGDPLAALPESRGGALCARPVHGEAAAGAIGSARDPGLGGDAGDHGPSDRRARSVAA